MEKEKDYTEQYRGVFMLRKAGENGEKWFATMGNVMISNQLYENKEECINALENLTLESVSRMMVAILNGCIEMINDKMKEK